MSTKDLTVFSFEPQTMSSREIAELTGKRHDNVLSVARELKNSGIIGSPEIQEPHPQNKQPYPIFYLNKVESLNLVARLSPEFMARIIDRWQELESARRSKPLSVMELVIASAQEIMRLEQEQARIESKVDALAEKVSEPNRETIHQHFVHQPDDPYYSQGYGYAKNKKRH